MKNLSIRTVDYFALLLLNLSYLVEFPVVHALFTLLIVLTLL